MPKNYASLICAFLAIPVLFIGGGCYHSWFVNEPLIDAASGCQVEQTRNLLERGGNSNHRSEGGDTPLSFASPNKCYEVASLLVDAGSNPTTKNDRGESPLDRARGDDKMLKILNKSHFTRPYE